MMMGENGLGNVFIRYLRTLFYNCDKFNDKTYLSFGISSLKTCTVSVLLDAHKNIESILNANELMTTHLK
jgi:hypothetical protein